MRKILLASILGIITPISAQVADWEKLYSGVTITDWLAFGRCLESSTGYKFPATGWTQYKSEERQLRIHVNQTLHDAGSSSMTVVESDFDLWVDSCAK